MRVKKKPFTLLEICICLMLISWLGAAIGWQIKSLVDSQRLSTEVNRLKLHLEELQTLALSHGADLQIHLIIHEEKRLICSVETDAPKIKEMKIKPLQFKSISYLTSGESQEPKNRESFKILSTGRIEFNKLLGFHQKKKKQAAEKDEKNSDALWIDMTKPLQIKIYNCYHPINQHNYIPKRPQKKVPVPKEEVS